MGLIRKYLSIFRLVFIERMAYRVNFILEILSGILSSLIIVFLWIAIYRHSGKQILGDYSLAEMVTYILGGGLINSFILTTAENPETSQSIQDGSLSNLLVQPVSPYWVWFFRDLGSKAIMLLLGFAGYIWVLVFFHNYLIVTSNAIFLSLFFVSLALATSLQFLLFESLSLLAFWVENTYGIRFTMRVILEVAGGAIIPLSFFPHILQKLFLLFPFPYMIYLPMRIYLGKIAISEVLVEFVHVVVWMMGLAICNIVLWRKGLRRYVAMGD